MCGIFGVLASDVCNVAAGLADLASFAEQRGSDSSGFMMSSQKGYEVVKADMPVTQLAAKVELNGRAFIIGHSRLATNGISDNQPVLRKGLVTVHNGIICNADELWAVRDEERLLSVDTEIIPVIVAEEKAKGRQADEIAESLFEQCEGVICAAILDQNQGELLLISNNGSLYTGSKGGTLFFASESWPLNQIGCSDVKQLKGALTWSLPISNTKITETVLDSRHRPSLLPEFVFSAGEEGELEYAQPEIKRCTKCILPETMPFIRFDAQGVCNYCHNYTPRNQPKPVSVLEDILEPYRRNGQTDCIVPFSGGRDSCYGLHMTVKELGMNPIAYTYDWGMVTDLGRRNISRMCAELGVENIIIAADIELKRRNIQKNLSAWLKKPHLGMMALLTAGDKHFFRHVETVKKQTGISLNLWGVNPLEVTHFKTGFLGIPPAFEEKRVYANGWMGQFNYHRRRFWEMFKNPAYLNRSLFDTLAGEYWRSINKKTDYFHIFDYWEWDEVASDQTLAQYNWEWAKDTSTSWRIGDATAAFYNYVYYTVAGFTEHDTFRSNQIREGSITREKALQLVADENHPRYESIKWYLDAVGIDFSRAIRVINSIPKLYETNMAAPHVAGLSK